MVEDVVDEVRLASLQLTRAGVEHEFVRVENETELRQALTDFQPALILSDFTLPRFDGMTALRLARQLAPDVPFVFFSGTIGEERAIEALKSGAVDYVLKSNARRLAAAVQRALQENAEQMARRRAEHLLRESDERLRRLNRVHAMLSHVNSAVLRIRDSEELLREACRIAIKHGQYATAWAGLLEDSGAMLRQSAGAGQYPHLFGIGPFTLDLGARGPENLLLRALRTRQYAIVERSVGAGALSGGPLRRELERNGLEGAVALPLLRGEQVAGVFALAAGSAQMFDAGEVKLLQELAGDLSYALQYIRQETRLRYLVNYDSLTGLANRDLFVLRLQQYIDAVARGGVLAVALFDLGRLSEINHTLGRRHGDELLREISARLRAGEPDSGRLAHLGGGVFATVFAGLGSESESFRLQDWFERRVLHQPLQLDGRELRISGHLGVALHPADGSEAAALLHGAEVALRNAKGCGERVMFSSPLLNARAARRLSLEGRLRNAFEREQFSMQLQPKVSLHTGDIVGFEALLRWFEPDREIIAPEVFVPALEEMGLIDAVGEWILRRASAVVCGWSATGARARIAVNVSARQLTHGDFAARARACLDARSGEDPRIDLELTESSLLADLDSSIMQLRAVRERGFGVAIDDFGTGYSSLNQLVRLPVDTLKIDKTFVQRMTLDRNVRAVVATITSLAESMHLNTVAEGVETAEQLAWLRELGCSEYQGYFFSPPVSAAAAGEMLGLSV
jgi:diguanylate cyclase (GGDEF)-like protein